MTSREALSNQEMENLLAAFGNNEAKAILLCKMPTHTIFTSQDLFKTLISAQGMPPGWIMGNKTPFEYCHCSLSPIGLVTYEVMDEQLQTFGYARLEYGGEVGVPRLVYY